MIFPIGKQLYAAGASGTVTLPEGAIITLIRSHSTAGGTCTIFGGDSIPIVATFDLHLPKMHPYCVATAAAKTVVFATTNSYYVEYIIPGFS